MAPKRTKKHELKDRINAVWEHGAPIGASPSMSAWRYVPRSYSGGTGWGVWDRFVNRFIDDNELITIPLDAILNEKLPTAMH